MEVLTDILKSPITQTAIVVVGAVILTEAKRQLRILYEKYPDNVLLKFGVRVVEDITMNDGQSD